MASCKKEIQSNLYCKWAHKSRDSAIVEVNHVPVEIYCMFGGYLEMKSFMCVPSLWVQSSNVRTQHIYVMQLWCKDSLMTLDFPWAHTKAHEMHFVGGRIQKAYLLAHNFILVSVTSHLRTRDKWMKALSSVSAFNFLSEFITDRSYFEISIVVHHWSFWITAFRESIPIIWLWN